VVHDLSTAGGMADVNRVLQIEMRRHRRKIVGIMIHVMAIGDLTGAAMAAAVMGDDAKTVMEEKQHLRVPIIGREWPAMAEHDGLPLAPVLVKDLVCRLLLEKKNGCFSPFGRGRMAGRRPRRPARHAVRSDQGLKTD